MPGYLTPHTRRTFLAASAPQPYFRPQVSAKIEADSHGHYSRPELPSLLIDRSATAHLHEREAYLESGAEQIMDLSALVNKK